MASKKTFKDNPALRFISAPEKSPAEAHKAKVKPDPIPDAPKPKATPKTDISVSSEVIKTVSAVPSLKEEVPEGYKRNPLYVETKSKRVQLVFQPSLLARVKAKATKSGLSLNEYCHRILDQATKEQ